MKETRLSCRLLLIKVLAYARKWTTMLADITLSNQTDADSRFKLLSFVRSLISVLQLSSLFLYNSMIVSFDIKSFFRF